MAKAFQGQGRCSAATKPRQRRCLSCVLIDWGTPSDSRIASWLDRNCRAETDRPWEPVGEPGSPRALVAHRFLMLLEPHALHGVRAGATPSDARTLSVTGTRLGGLVVEQFRSYRHCEAGAPPP